MSKLQVTAPYDGALLKTYDYHTEEQALEVLSKAFTAYENRGGWLSGKRRIEILDALAERIESSVDELALQAAREGGKPLQDSRVEIRRAINGVKVARDAVAKLNGHEVPMGINEKSLGRWAITYREPRGVVLAISAFNHPFNLLVHQVVTAIAAGCPVVVKPAATTPMSCESLVSMVREAGL